MIKRFVWMAGYTYYASGGFKDYRGSYDTKEEVEALQKIWLEDSEYKWSHICDLETGMIYGQGGGRNPMAIFQD